MTRVRLPFLYSFDKRLHVVLLSNQHNYAFTRLSASIAEKEVRQAKWEERQHEVQSVGVSWRDGL